MEVAWANEGELNEVEKPWSGERGLLSSAQLQMLCDHGHWCPSLGFGYPIAMGNRAYNCGLREGSPVYSLRGGRPSSRRPSRLLPLCWLSLLIVK